METEFAPYGYCPVCSGVSLGPADGSIREGPPTGELDYCKNGHIYLSTLAFGAYQTKGLVNRLRKWKSQKNLQLYEMKSQVSEG